MANVRMSGLTHHQAKRITIDLKYDIVVYLNYGKTFIYSAIFVRIFDKLIKDRKLLQEDFDKFENDLLKDPQMGDVIPGMAGLRKVRIKSSSRGKRGGFRLDYLDFPEYGITYYIIIYPKNVKDDLNEDEKKIILKMIEQIKRGAKYE